MQLLITSLSVPPRHANNRSRNISRLFRSLFAIITPVVVSSATFFSILFKISGVGICLFISEGLVRSTAPIDIAKLKPLHSPSTLHSLIVEIPYARVSPGKSLLRALTRFQDRSLARSSGNKHPGKSMAHATACGRGAHGLRERSVAWVVGCIRGQSRSSENEETGTMSSGNKPEESGRTRGMG